jgi:hypothetical protein
MSEDCCEFNVERFLDCSLLLDTVVMDSVNSSTPVREAVISIDLLNCEWSDVLCGEARKDVGITDAIVVDGKLAPELEVDSKVCAWLDHTSVELVSSATEL